MSSDLGAAANTINIYLPQRDAADLVQF